MFTYAAAAPAASFPRPCHALSAWRLVFPRGGDGQRRRFLLCFSSGLCRAEPFPTRPLANRSVGDTHCAPRPPNETRCCRYDSLDARCCDMLSADSRSHCCSMTHPATHETASVLPASLRPTFRNLLSPARRGSTSQNSSKKFPRLRRFRCSSFLFLWFIFPTHLVSQGKRVKRRKHSSAPRPPNETRSSRNES